MVPGCSRSRAVRRDKSITQSKDILIQFIAMRELLSTLRENNIRLKLVEGELSVKFPKGKVNKTLLDEIKLNKVHLIDYLTTINEYDYLDIPQVNKHDNYPMSSGQKRLWILSQLNEGSVA